jgi:hypothetical protein
MTVSLNMANIVDAIAAVSITGVTIKDVDQVAGSFLGQSSILYPNIDGPFVTNFRPEYKAITRGAAAPVNALYTLNYRYLYVAVGDIAILPKAYSDCFTKLIAILNALMAVDAPYSGGVDMFIQDVTDLHPLPDPVGNMFYSFDIALAVEEIQN